MANSPQVYDAAAIAALNAQTVLANSGSLKIYTGAQPGVDGALTGTLLVSLSLSATAFQTATASGSGASATANPVTPADAVATGTAGYFAILKSDGVTVVATGSVGTSGADLNLNSVSVEIGTNMSISSFTITQPQSLAMASHSVSPDSRAGPLQGPVPPALSPPALRLDASLAQGKRAKTALAVSDAAKES